MGSRSTYDRRIEQLEWAIDAAVDDLPALAPEQLRRADTGPLHALEIAPAALDARLRRVALHVPAVAPVTVP
jgi:hypothetical protein